MKKRALIVGINYEGSSYQLRGCINDANNVQSLLVARGFEVELLLEKQATTQNILQSLRQLVQGAEPGDVLVFHYSGHGSQMPSSLEDDKMDEIICPVDLNWIDKVITDNELKDIFNPVPNGVNVTVILDCCHSGTGLDQQQTATVIPTVTESSITTDIDIVKDRYLPMPAHIQQQTKKMQLRDWDTSRDINSSALLIAACRPNQKAIDTVINGEACGVATHALLAQLETKPDSSYQEIINSMTGFMIANKFSQRPQLDGAPYLYNRKFLDPWIDISSVVITEPGPVAAPVIVDITPENKKQIILIGLLVLALVLFVAFA